MSAPLRPLRARAPTMGGDAGRSERVSLLGKGATSTVYRARRLSDGRHFAYKLVKLTGFSEVQRAEILNEVECMTRLHHPNVVSYEESFVHSDHLHIVMELLSGGDLAREVESRSSGPNGERPPAYLDEEVIWSILVQVCEGLHHMHSVRVLHRDIKAENIYSDGRGAVKIGDLASGGCCRRSQRMHALVWARRSISRPRCARSARTTPSRTCGHSAASCTSCARCNRPSSPPTSSRSHAR